MFAGVNNGTLPSGDEGYVGLREGNGSEVKGEGYIGLAASEGGCVTGNHPTTSHANSAGVICPPKHVGCAGEYDQGLFSVSHKRYSLQIPLILQCTFT
jgi:hypothetical protein